MCCKLLVNLRKVGTNQIISFDDAEYLNIMTDLRANNLLMKTDIRDQEILFWSCSSTNKLRFEYLADWSQDGLKTYKYKGFPIFHSLIKHRLIPAAVFPTFLGVSVLRHPQDMSCLLFQKDHNGKTACEYAFERYGKEETFNVLGDLIPTDAPAFSILHHVAKHAPQYIDDFAIR